VRAFGDVDEVSVDRADVQLRPCRAVGRTLQEERGRDIPISQKPSAAGRSAPKTASSSGAFDPGVKWTVPDGSGVGVGVATGLLVADAWDCAAEGSGDGLAVGVWPLHAPTTATVVRINNTVRCRIERLLA
jgi:hypothetical protein